MYFQNLCLKTFSSVILIFVFDEFSLLFSLSREAYDQLMDDYQFYPLSQDSCSFCEVEGGVKQLTGFPDTTFFSDIYICHKCFHLIRAEVNEL